VPNSLPFVSERPPVCADGAAKSNQNDWLRNEVPEIQMRDTRGNLEGAPLTFARLLAIQVRSAICPQPFPAASRAASLTCGLARTAFASAKSTQGTCSRHVRFTPHSEEIWLVGRRAWHDSAITYEFSALGACAEKRMSFCVSPGTYRWFFGCTRNGSSF
jgi:hypothetical protein